jgi:hypothetical protein
LLYLYKRMRDCCKCIEQCSGGDDDGREVSVRGRRTVIIHGHTGPD